MPPPVAGRGRTIHGRKIILVLQQYILHGAETVFVVVRQQKRSSADPPVSFQKRGRYSGSTNPSFVSRAAGEAAAIRHKKFLTGILHQHKAFTLLKLMQLHTFQTEATESKCFVTHTVAEFTL